MKFDPEEIRRAQKELLSIQNRIEDIQIVIEKFEQFAEKAKVNSALLMKINIVFDELMANIIRYAFEDDHDHIIYLEFVIKDQSLFIIIEDDGVAFDPFSQDPPDTSLTLEQREIGGLGIHLVKNLMDEYEYVRNEKRNVVKLVKHHVK
jgi:anti-sigma regulatory factor (Ser/Thr protein kinase)